MTILETERLILRPFTMEDVDAFAPICADPDVMKYIGKGTTQTREQVEATLKRWMEKTKSENHCALALIEKSSKQLIGFCCLYPQVVDGEDCVELGYRLKKSHWRQGLAYEAACAVRDYAFNKIGHPELISIIQKENDRSINLAKRVGMTLLKETVFEEIPVYIYHLKNPE